MPFDFKRDDDRRRVTVTIWGSISTEQDLEIIARFRREPELGRYGILYDAVGAIGTPTINDAKLYIDQELATLGSLTRGPVAVLVSDPGIYNIACVYAALGHGTLNIQVFRNRDDAEHWLAKQSVDSKSPAFRQTM
jgi:hypothetical protein